MSGTMKYSVVALTALTLVSSSLAAPVKTPESVQHITYTGKVDLCTLFHDSCRNSVDGSHHTIVSTCFRQSGPVNKAFCGGYQNKKHGGTELTSYTDQVVSNIAGAKMERRDNSLDERDGGDDDSELDLLEERTVPPQDQRYTEEYIRPNEIENEGDTFENIEERHEDFKAVHSREKMLLTDEGPIREIGVTMPKKGIRDSEMEKLIRAQRQIIKYIGRGGGN